MYFIKNVLSIQPGINLIAAVSSQNSLSQSKRFWY